MNGLLSFIIIVVIALAALNVQADDPCGDIDTSRNVIELIEELGRTRLTLKNANFRERNIIVENCAAKWIQLFSHEAGFVKGSSRELVVMAMNFKKSLSSLTDASIRVIKSTDDLSLRLELMDILGRIASAKPKLIDDLIKKGVVEISIDLIGNYPDRGDVLTSVAKLFREMLSTKRSIDTKKLEVMLVVLKNMLSEVNTPYVAVIALNALSDLINQRSMRKFYDEQLFTQLLSSMGDFPYEYTVATEVALSLLKHLPANRREQLIESKLLPRLKEIVIGSDILFPLRIVNAMHLIDGLIYNNCDYAHDLLNDAKFVEKLEQLLQILIGKLTVSVWNDFSSHISEINSIKQIVDVISTECPSIENIDNLSNLQSLLQDASKSISLCTYNPNLSKLNSQLFKHDTSLVEKLRCVKLTAVVNHFMPILHKENIDQAF